MLEQILPSSAAVAVATADVPAPLYPEEARVVERAVAKRQHEFATTRACARRALAQIGVPAQPIPTGPKGEPCWPEGVVGSITHCDGLRACAVARARDLLSLGIDAEPGLPLPEGVLESVARPEERDHLDALAAERPGISWDRLLFSIKESTYKAWFPLARGWLGFEEASVVIDPVTGRFSVRLLVPGPAVGERQLGGFEGRWLSTSTHLLTAIAPRR